MTYKITLLAALLCATGAFASNAFAQGATMSPPAPFSAQSMPESPNSVPLHARTLAPNRPAQTNGAGLAASPSGQAKTNGDELIDAPQGSTVPSPQTTSHKPE